MGADKMNKMTNNEADYRYAQPKNLSRIPARNKALETTLDTCQ